MADASVEILLVEDNPNDVELTLRAFKKHNLTNPVRVARDGAEALAFIFANGQDAQGGIAHTPKFILLDLKIPKIDGLEVLRRLKADPRTQSIPVVILTSSREDQDMLRSYASGVNSYIVKPVDFEQFTEAARILGMYWTLLNEPPAVGSGEA